MPVPGEDATRTYLKGLGDVAMRENLKLIEQRGWKDCLFVKYDEVKG